MGPVCQSIYFCLSLSHTLSSSPNGTLKERDADIEVGEKATKGRDFVQKMKFINDIIN